MTTKNDNKKSKSKQSSSYRVRKTYNTLLKDMPSSPYIGLEWPQEDGLYKHYSAYDESIKCISKTV